MSVLEASFRSGRTFRRLRRQCDGTCRPLTEASGEHIVLLSPFTCRQLVIEAELPIAVIAAQRAIFLCTLGEKSGVDHVLPFIQTVPSALGEPYDIVKGGGWRPRLGGIKRDNRAIGEACTFAK